MTRTFKKKFSKSPGSFKNKSKNLSSRKSLIKTNRPKKNSRKNKKKQMGGGLEGFTKMRSLDFLKKVKGYNKFEIGTLDVEHIKKKKVLSITSLWKESVTTSFKKHTLSYYYPHTDWDFLSKSSNIDFDKVKKQRKLLNYYPDSVYLVLQKTTSNDEVYFCEVEPDYVIETNVISPYRIYFPKQSGQFYLCFNYPKGDNNTPKINLKVQIIDLKQSKIRHLYRENFSEAFDRGLFYEGDWNNKELKKEIEKKNKKP